MNDDNKNKVDKQASDTTENAALTEHELDGISGGFTLIDTCQHSWDSRFCTAIWGKCPHLQTKDTGQKTGNFSHYLLSCDKGYFNDIPHSSIPDNRTTQKA